MMKAGGKTFWVAGLLLFGLCTEAPAVPLVESGLNTFSALNVVPVVVFGRNSRKTVDEMAAQDKVDPVELRRTFAASGLVQCGAAHGAGQLTIADNVITTAAHVFFDENGVPRAKSCNFAIEVDGALVSTPIDLKSIVAGSLNPYAVEAAHDWAVAKLARPVAGATPYGIADAPTANMPVEFVSRGHIDWGEGHRLSMEKCLFHDQLARSEEGTREFSFDCETGDGASGGAVIMGAGKPLVGAILVGWRSNRPFKAVPFSPTHYNFAVTIEGAFKAAVLATANKVMVAK